MPWYCPEAVLWAIIQSKPEVMSEACTIVLLLAMTTIPCDAIKLRSVG